MFLKSLSKATLVLTAGAMLVTGAEISLNIKNISNSSALGIGEFGLSSSIVSWSQTNDYITWDVYRYNGSSVVKLTNTSEEERSVAVFENRTTWASGSVSDIYLHDGATTKRLTNNNYVDQSPVLTGNYTLWSGASGTNGSSELFVNNGYTTNQLTNDNSDDYSPIISKLPSSPTMIVWSRYNPATYETSVMYGEIAENNLRSSVQIPLQVGSDRYSLSGRNFVFEANPNIYNTDICLFNGTGITNISNSPGFDILPSICGNQVAYVSYNYDKAFGPGTIYLYNLATQTKQALKVINGPDISNLVVGDQGVIWVEEDGLTLKRNLYLYASGHVKFVGEVAGYGKAAISGNCVAWLADNAGKPVLKLATFSVN